MIKKIVSLLLVTVTILSLAAPPICAEALNADNIPIVEYIPQNPATPSVLSNEGSSDDRYADAKIISVSREATLTSKQTDLANLMNERNVVFFKNQSAYEVSQATGIPSGLSCDSTETSTVLLGTSVTKIDEQYFFTESVAVPLLPTDEPCDDCGENCTGECGAINPPEGGSPIVITDDDYNCAARDVYYSERLDVDAEIRASILQTPYGFKREIYVFHKQERVGRLSMIVMTYKRGRMYFDGQNRDVYDVVVLCKSAPKSNRKVKSFMTRIGHDYNTGYRSSCIIDESEIPSYGKTHSVELGLNAGANSSGEIEAGLGVNFTWSYESKAFNCANDFFESRYREWRIKPKTSVNTLGDAWKMQPGIRTFNNGNSGKYFFVRIETELRNGYFGMTRGKGSYEVHCSFD